LFNEILTALTCRKLKKNEVQIELIGYPYDDRYGPNYLPNENQLLFTLIRIGFFRKKENIWVVNEIMKDYLLSFYNYLRKTDIIKKKESVVVSFTPRV
jgi:hypothetical protein